MNLKNNCLNCLLQNILNNNNTLTFNNHFIYNCPNINKEDYIKETRNIERFIKDKKLFKYGTCYF